MNLGEEYMGAPNFLDTLNYVKIKSYPNSWLISLYAFLSQISEWARRLNALDAAQVMSEREASVPRG